ncbi:MAG: DNA polymerase III subunit delta [Elusimicrobiota bacterium]|nr:DNA polymerase III subunit delta [Elusimicrobiota bacterium]
MELSPDELAREWKTGKFRPVYYLFGEEPAAKAEALKSLKAAFKADDFNLREFSGDAGSEAPAVVAEAMTLPVFSDRRLVIARNPKLTADAKAVFADYLRSPSPSTTLVLLSDDRRPDKKDAFAAAVSAAGAVVVFAPLDPEAAVRRLVEEAKRQGKELSADAAEALVEESGTDWPVLVQELEKALLFAGKEKTVGLEAVGACLGYRKNIDPWAFEKLAQGRDLKACMAYLRDLFAEDKPEAVVFSTLSRCRAAYLKQLRAKRLLRQGVAQREIETRLRIFYDNGFFQRAGRVTEERLRRDLRRCLEVESDLKSKTWLDPRVELERLVVELCTPTAKISA